MIRAELCGDDTRCAARRKVRVYHRSGGGETVSVQYRFSRALYFWVPMVCLVWTLLAHAQVSAEDQPIEGFPAAPISIQPEDNESAPGEAPQPAQPKSPPFVLYPPYSAATPLPLHGHAMYYNPGVMARVLSYRLQHNQVQLCRDCVGFAALLRVGDLNRRIWLQWEDGSIEGPFHVIDAADPRHIPTLLARHWAVDLDYRSAQRRNMNRPLPVTVLAQPPAPPPTTVTAPVTAATPFTGAVICAAVELHC
jgi:hypothetical protein